MNKIEIFEEDGDNTLSLNDKYSDFTIDVYPESKTYQSRMNLKDDVYYRTEQFEYRIKTDPVKVETRLTERVDEPPEEYMVRDGVVLESEIIQKNNLLGKDFIDGLKKEVEWHEEWVGNPVSMYILSKHPEIINPEDYRRHLRQLSEKIKNSMLKVEKALESDKMGLQVTDEYEGSGRTIWYTRAKQDKMSKEEINKAIEHKKKIQEQLFDDKSSEYVGVSEGEFRSSADILANIEVFLNKKPAPTIKEQRNKFSFGVKFGAFIFQWFWLFGLVSIALWLLSLIVTIIQYNFAFAFFVSGILAFFLLLRNKQ
jgi:hypothetical protein